jgi:hypothetical protein
MDRKYKITTYDFYRPAPSGGAVLSLPLMPVLINIISFPGNLVGDPEAVVIEVYLFRGRIGNFAGFVVPYGRIVVFRILFVVVSRSRRCFRRFSSGVEGYASNFLAQLGSSLCAGEFRHTPEKYSPQSVWE